MTEASAATPITIYIDADACPVKQEVYRVAERHGVRVVVVSNSPIAVPREPYIERAVVASGMDKAADYIAERADKGVIVVTADIPLAARAVASSSVSAWTKATPRPISPKSATKPIVTMAMASRP